MTFFTLRFFSNKIVIITCAIMNFVELNVPNSYIDETWYNQKVLTPYAKVTLGTIKSSTLFTYLDLFCPVSEYSESGQIVSLSGVVVHRSWYLVTVVPRVIAWVAE